MFTFAFISQIMLLVYFAVTTLINLYPWIDLSKYTPKEKITEAAVNAITIIIGNTFMISKKQALMVIAAIFCFLFLLVQLVDWWMPYITGKHLKQFPRELYDSHFQDTLKILPPIKEHIIPDAQHNVLQFLSLEVFIVSLLAIIN